MNMTKMNELMDSRKNEIGSTPLNISSAEGDSEDEIQMSLAPYIQTYFEHNNSGNSCGCLPVPFERAAPHSWMLPSFDSDTLEKQFKISSFKQYTKRFRFALIYMMIVSAAWLIFLLCQPYPDAVKFEYVIFVQMFLFAMWILFLSYKNIYRSHDSIFGGVTALHLVLTFLLFALTKGTAIVSHFTMVYCTILVIYTIFPLQPYISLIICLFFSIAFETIIVTTQNQLSMFYYGFVVRILCHICMHIIGFHILVMTHVRVRGTFMKVGQRLLVRKQLEMEKRLKENIIHSVMPPKVANWLLSGERNENHQDDFGSLFRPFNMNRMDNVSILFADIVGFTKMSSNKTAEEIVGILNDLFERFDDLCVANGCEKISTLGDCYYCVSGCPEPRPDHAKCCVEMGLDMIDAIREFDIDRGEDVNMRVGVHTGTVLCGIVGTRRFKFDVWSNDVTFANKLESTGVPGRVHISERTALLLRESYVLENYDDLQGVKTYLIKSRTPVVRQEIQVAELPAKRNYNIDRKSVNFGNNSSSKRSHYLSLLTNARSKFTSLPNVLGSSRALTGSLEKLNYYQWFSFSKLKKNSSSEEASSLRQKNLEDASNSRSSICKFEVPLRRDLKPEEAVCPVVSNRNLAIRNGNRRRSIQQQIYLLNGLNQEEMAVKKFNSIHNSTQSNLSPLDSESANESSKMTGPASDRIDLGFYSMRKQSDLQLVKCINDVSQNNYIVNVPLDPITLFFKDRVTEQEYRANAHKIHEKKGNSPATLSTSRFNTYFDIFVSGLILVCTMISLYLLHEPAPCFVAASTVALLLQSVAVFLCLVHLIKTASDKIDDVKNFFGKKIFNLFSEWYPWHIFGGILVSLPMIVILTDFSCDHAIYEWWASGLGGGEGGGGELEQEPEEELVSMNNFTFSDFLSSRENRKLMLNVELCDHYYTLLILIGLLHFCNFTQLNFFMKSCLALIAGIAYLVLFSKSDFRYADRSKKLIIFIGQFLSGNVFFNESLHHVGENQNSGFLCCREFEEIIRRLSSGEVFDPENYHNLTVRFLDLYYSGNVNLSRVFHVTRDGIRFLENLNRTASDLGSKNAWIENLIRNTNGKILISHTSETILNISVVLLLVLLLNREFEISYRLSYYCNTESDKDKMRVQRMKNQADWLLENIIPKHVSIELKNRAKYCENHSNVGIMFASIVNFNKLYDETYSGGKEYLRVLNELISDFDELLNVDRFKNVDKIKTIGSTFMGASGLNPAQRKKNNTEDEHIFELMNFALEMYKVMEVFNGDLLGFNLVLRVGFNVGEVTAGVIGSCKLFYDIWGDAVNVASRMDSCGVDGRIQVPHSCLKVLSARYELEPRGSIYIKGKGDTLVYLVK